MADNCVRIVQYNMMTVQKRCAVGMMEGFVYNGD